MSKIFFSSGFEAFENELFIFSIDKFLLEENINSTNETLGVGTLLPLGRLPEGSSAEVEMIVANDVETITINDCGISIGAPISVSEGKITTGGMEIGLSDGISMKILARITSMGE